MSHAHTSQEGLVAALGDNRRAAVRYHCPATLGKLYRSADQEFQLAYVLNLSLQGLGLQLANPPELDQFIYIVLKSRSGAKTYELSGQVIHLDTLPNNDYYVGCALTLALTPEDLEQLL